jgi:hypothetical protein
LTFGRKNFTPVQHFARFLHLYNKGEALTPSPQLYIDGDGGGRLPFLPLSPLTAARAPFGVPVFAKGFHRTSKVS